MPAVFCTIKSCLICRICMKTETSNNSSQAAACGLSRHKERCRRYTMADLEQHKGTLLMVMWWREQLSKFICEKRKSSCRKTKQNILMKEKRVLTHWYISAASSPEHPGTAHRSVHTTHSVHLAFSAKPVCFPLKCWMRGRVDELHFSSEQTLIHPGAILGSLSCFAPVFFFFKSVSYPVILSDMCANPDGGHYRHLAAWNRLWSSEKFKLVVSVHT